MAVGIPQTRKRKAIRLAPKSPIVAAIVLALLPCGGWAQQPADAQLTAQVAKQIKRLGDKDPAVRVNAVFALSEMGPGAKDALPALSDILAKDSDEGVRSQAATALGQIGPESISALSTCLAKDKDSIVRAAAAEALKHIGPKSVPALTIALVRDGDPWIREIAADALGHIGPDAKEAIPALSIALAKDPDQGVRREVADALGQIGPGEKEAIPPLILAAANDSNPEVRARAAWALRNFGSSAKKAIPVLSTALAKDSDSAVRAAAADACGYIGPESVPALSTALSQDRDIYVRRLAAEALERIGPGAKGAAPILSIALAKDSDATVRVHAAAALGQFGSESIPALRVAVDSDADEGVREEAVWALGLTGPEAVSALSATLLKDENESLRRGVAQALGHLGPEGRGAIPALSAILAKDPNETVRLSAIEALGEIGPEAFPSLRAVLISTTDKTEANAAAAAIVRVAEIARDSRRTELIEEMTQWPKVLGAASYPDQAAKVRTAVDLLRAMRAPWYNVFYKTLRKHLWLVCLLGSYLCLALFWLILLWKQPSALWRINESLQQVPKIKLTGKLAEVEVSVPSLILVGFLHFHPRVLDAWVAERAPTARRNFAEIDTARQREVHVEVPVELDRRAMPELKPSDLSALFGRDSACLLVWGEGGAGKTSLACQIARWCISDDLSLRPTAYRMLPVMIEQDLDLEVEVGKTVLMEVIRGELKKLTGEVQAPNEEMVRHLLQQKRILLVVDGLSELSESTRNKLRPLNPDFPANALVVTSRVEEPLDGIPKTSVRPLRIQGNRLSSFMEAYLTRCGKRGLFDDTEFFEGCRKLSEIVADRDTTPLLAKLYAEQMIASKEGGEHDLPRSIPELMLQYLNELNRKQDQLGEREVHSAAAVIAWECLRETYRPASARIEAVLESLSGDTAKDRFNYLERKLQLIQVIGVARDKVKFVLDPLAEYLAGYHVVKVYRRNEQAWGEFLAKAVAVPNGHGMIKGFLLAVRDCCLVWGDEYDIPDFVMVELSKLSGWNSEQPRPD